MRRSARNGRIVVVVLLLLALAAPIVWDIASPHGALRHTAAWRTARRVNAQLHRWCVRFGFLDCERCRREAGDRAAAGR